MTMTLSGQLSVGALAAHAAGGDITSVCAGSESGSTFTLSADCDTTSTLNQASGLCLDDPSFAKPNGTLTDQWTCNGGTNQLWHF
jgi:hypothetical protein